MAREKLWDEAYAVLSIDAASQDVWKRLASIVQVIGALSLHNPVRYAIYPWIATVIQR